MGVKAPENIDKNENKREYVSREKTDFKNWSEVIHFFENGAGWENPHGPIGDIAPILKQVDVPNDEEIISFKNIKENQQYGIYLNKWIIETNNHTIEFEWNQGAKSTPPKVTEKEKSN